jgi:hypothetical protein
LAYSSTLNMEATCSSATSDDFQRTTRRYITKDRNLEFCKFIEGEQTLQYSDYALEPLYHAST